MRARGVEVVDDAAGLEAASRLPIAALFAVEPQQSEPRSPTPEAMARKAIELLSGSGRPFFLLVEDEEIDTAAHANDGARMSRALRRFDAAVAAAAAFAARDGETLVLVLGDHATGGLTIDSRSQGRELALLWGGRGHTGEPVPAFAYGPPPRPAGSAECTTTRRFRASWRPCWASSFRPRCGRMNPEPESPWRRSR